MSTADTGRETDERQRLAPAGLIGILWGTAWQALAATIGLFVLGGLAYGICSSIWNEMTPSLPPLSQTVKAGLSSLNTQAARPEWASFVREHRFGIVFGFVYAGLAGLQLASCSRSKNERRIAAVLTRITRRISDRWFEVVVGNAFGALFGAIGIHFLHEWSFVRLVAHLTLGWLHPVIYSAASLVFDTDSIQTIEGLIRWYDDNQFKFTFWMLYGSAVLDDLGVPNLKTLGKRGWRRIGDRPAGPNAAPPSSPPPPAPEP